MEYAIEFLTSSTGSFWACNKKVGGVLLVTTHLGNWELGGPALSRRGVALHVITLAEPGQAFTNLRRASRARSAGGLPAARGWRAG